MWRYHDGTFKINPPVTVEIDGKAGVCFLNLSPEQRDSIGYNEAVPLIKNPWYTYTTTWVKQNLTYIETNTVPPSFKIDVCCSDKENAINEHRKSLIYGSITINGQSIRINKGDRGWLERLTRLMENNPNETMDFKYTDSAGKTQFTSINKTMVDATDEQIKIFEEACFTEHKNKLNEIRGIANDVSLGLRPESDLTDYDTGAGWPSTSITTP